MPERRIDEVSPQNGIGLATCHAIRKTVFCGEQGVPEALELDDLDPIARHYLAFDGLEAVATARMRDYTAGCVKIERVAVLARCRGAGVGQQLMLRLLADARASGAREALLNAQMAVESFYTALGFVRRGEPFMDAGIPHIQMTLALSGAS